MKLDRYDGEVPIFSEDYEGRERTLFGSATESNNINDQFTPEFMRGWGIVGDTEFPTLQDFNALGFTHGKLISYLYQAGIPSYTANEKYYAGSIVQYNNDIYLCTATEPTSLPTNTRDWVKWQSSLGELAQTRADKNGFLLNKAGEYNALIDTDLVQTTGQSQTKIMTQKAITDALGQKQNSLTFVGTGPEVMRKGAYGVGFQVTANASHDILAIENYTTGFSWFWAISSINRPFDRNGFFRVNKINNQHAIIEYTQDGGNKYINRLALGVWSGWISIYSETNTRTDKNNVLHSGTSTPINTLNVSDMNQDVINNDNLTVTSGAVYRGLGKKWDIQQTTGTGNVARMSEVNKKITGGSVVQKTGTSTTNVMSQKAFTDLSFGIGQSWVDVTSERMAGTTYTNNTGKPIFVAVAFPDTIGYNARAKVTVDGVQVFSQHYDEPDGVAVSSISFPVPSGSEYIVDNITNAPNKIESWSELR